MVKLETLLPREKAILYGIETLEDYEILALILQVGTRKENVLELSKKLLYENGGFKGLLSEETVLNYYGVGKATKEKISAIREIIKRVSKSEIIKINSTLDILNYTALDFDDLNLEKTIVIYLSNNKKILKKEKYSLYKENQTVLPINEILKQCLLLQCKYVIILHNHPSGNILPSKNDIYLTEQIYSSLLKIQVILLDSIIIYEKEYFSLRDNNIKPFP